MVSQPRDRCDEDRLRRFFEDDSEGPDRDEILAHLEGCPTCQRRLDQFSADCPWWEDVRRFAPDWTSGPSVPPPEVAEFLDPPTAEGDLGQFGPYRITEVIGRGGMGVVLGAFDPSLHRKVAIKVLAPQLAAVASARRRFGREARAAASICHEHVVSIHAVDEWKGLPYLVMPFIPGRSLQERIDQSGPADLEAILRIGMQAAAGLAAAHAQGLIHRDIKPSNVLLENGVERVKITDFGLARMTDDASVTESGVLAGTPQYMSPEQARGEAIDHRADLFSLGGVLYATATGHAPFRASTTMGVLRRVCEDHPRPIRESSPELPPWLDAIIAKLLAKAPEQRYQTAEEVATVLGACLAHVQQPNQRPLPLLPPSPPANAGGGNRRRRRGVLAGVMALAGGLALAAIVTIRVRTPEGTLVIETEDPAVHVSVDGDEVRIDGDGLSEVRLKVGDHQVRATNRGGRPLLQEVVTIRKDGKEIVKVHREPPAPPLADGPPATASPPPARASVDPAGPAMDGAGGAVEARASMPGMGGPPLRPYSTLRPAQTTVQEGWIRAVAFDPRSASVSWGGTSKNLMSWGPRWDEPATTIERDQGIIEAIAFSPDGKTLALGDGLGMVEVRDGTTGRGIRTIEVSPKFQVHSVAFSPDGQTLATGSRNGHVDLWKVETGENLRAGFVEGQPISHVRFTPSGRALLTATGEWSAPTNPSTIRLWDFATQKMRGTFSHPWGRVSALALAPDGETFATGSSDGIRLWSTQAIAVQATFPERDALKRPGGFVPGPEAIAVLKTDDWQVNALAFSPDGQTLASGQNQGQVTIWNVADRKVRNVLGGRAAKVLAVAFSADGKNLAAGGSDGHLDVWSVPVETSPAPAIALPAAFGAERPLIAAPVPPPIRTWPNLGGEVSALAFAPDGESLTWGGRFPKLETWTLPDGPQVTTDRGRSDLETLAFAPDGKTFALGDNRGLVEIRDAATRSVLRTIEASPGFQVFSLVYGPKGKTLATASRNGHIGLWDLATGEALSSPSDQDMPVLHVRFTPDGNTLIAATGDFDQPKLEGRILFWDVAGRWASTLPHPKGRVSALAVSPDGQTLATGSGDGIQTWSMGRMLKTFSLVPKDDPVAKRTKPTLIAEFKNDDWQVNVLAFSPDGRTLASGQNRGQVTLWDVAGNPSQTILGGRDAKITALAFAPDGNTIASGGSDGRVDLWPPPAPTYPAVATPPPPPAAEAAPDLPANPFTPPDSTAPLAQILADKPTIRPHGTFRYRLFLMDLETGKASPIVDEPGQGYTYCGSPSWSSDGRRIVFDATPESEWSRSRLYELDAATRGPAQDLGLGNCPSYTPDGRRIVFLSNVTGQSGLHVMNADGSGRAPLVGYGRPKCSPDGQRVLISEFLKSPNFSLVSLDPRGPQRTFEVPGKTIHPIPSWASASTIVAAIGGERADAIALLDVARDDAAQAQAQEAEPDFAIGRGVTDLGQPGFEGEAVEVRARLAPRGLRRPRREEDPPIEAKVKTILWKFGAGAGPAVTPSCPVYHEGTRRCVFVGAEEKGMALYSLNSGGSEPPKRLEAGDGLDPFLSDLAFSPDGRYVIFQTNKVDRPTNP